MTYRILSLDGGGPWALIQACVLADLFGCNTPGHRILKQFNLAIANSGGSITLAGLIKNLTPNQILQQFMTEADRRKIFVKRNPFLFWLASKTGFGPKWKAAAKREGLRCLINGPRGALGDTKLTCLPDLPGKLQIIITAFDYDQNREIFFRRLSSKLANQTPPFVPTLADAVHASTNAPINYFDEPAINRTGTVLRRFWDGGVGGYNNPVLRGVIEALANDSTLEADRVKALSIGTGSVWRPMVAHTQRNNEALFVEQNPPCLKADIARLATAILDDPPDAASLGAHVITRAPNCDPRVIRLSPMISPVFQGGAWQLPRGYCHFPSLQPMEAFSRLVTMPMDAVKQEQVETIKTLAQEWIAGRIPNQPILHDQTTGNQIIGHACYPSGKMAWLRLCPTRSVCPPPSV